MDIKVKTVAFNVLDPDQKRMFDYVSKRTNFSAYIKRLIDRDMQGYCYTEKQKENVKQFMEGLI